MNFRKACYDKIVEAFKLYDIDYDPSQIAIRVTLTGESVAGKAGYKERNGVRRYYVDFNTRAIERYPDLLVNNTIPHEIAHLVCYIKPELGSGHNWGWKTVCRALGGDGKKHHQMNLNKR